MPDLILQCVGYGLLVILVVAFAILIGPSLFSSPKTETRDDDDQELCKSCGYDVRGVVNCPECGKPTPEGRRQHLAKLREDWPTETIAPRVPDADEQPVVILTHRRRNGRSACCASIWTRRGISAKAQRKARRVSRSLYGRKSRAIA